MKPYKCMLPIVRVFSLLLGEMVVFKITQKQWY